MYFGFYRLIVVIIIINCLCTIAFINSTTNSNNNLIDPVIRSLQHIVDSALQDDTSDDIDSDLLIEQLSQILEREEGFRLDDRKRRSLYSFDDENARIFDGSGTAIYSNESTVTITMGPTTTVFTEYIPTKYSPCQCEKGERGEKGDPGICPSDCTTRYSPPRKDCLGSRINLEHLAQSLRQLIIDTKKIAYRNARAVPCVCSPSSPLPLPTVPTTSTTSLTSTSSPFTLDYNTYMRLKGDKGSKGDAGTSCSSTCTQQPQSNIRIFKTLKQAVDASMTYPDHTYVHIVTDQGRLQGVYIRVQGQLIPFRLESDSSHLVQESITPATISTTPRAKCSSILPCQRLHLFAVGPQVRKMCHPKRPDILCSKLSDYDDLCELVSRRQNLMGSYRAFMSTSTHWLSNMFAGTCVNANVVNMNDQILFETVDDMFQQKPPQSEILDAQGLKPAFQFWWHGTSVNGSASSDTCHDWNRLDSSLSGIASRIPDGKHGLFHPQYTWPCSIGDSNMGILCIETNCRRMN